jgi:hypothetical protein
MNPAVAPLREPPAAGHRLALVPPQAVLLHHPGRSWIASFGSLGSGCLLQPLEAALECSGPRESAASERSDGLDSWLQMILTPAVRLGLPKRTEQGSQLPWPAC